MLTLNTNEEIMMIKAQTPASFPLEVFIQVTSSCSAARILFMLQLKIDELQKNPKISFSVSA